MDNPRLEEIAFTETALELNPQEPVDILEAI